MQAVGDLSLHASATQALLSPGCTKTPKPVYGMNRNGCTKTPEIRSQVEGGVHQADVGEGLGEVANQAIVGRVVLFRQQSDVVSQAEQALVEADCLVTASHEGEGVNEPEVAGEEDPLVAG